MAKYVISATRLNDDGTIYSVSHPIEVDSDMINTIKIFDKIYVKQKHGKWVKNDNGTYSCSECYSWIPNEQHDYAKYCLCCGVKMDSCK